MKGTGSGLMPIVEVPSEGGESSNTEFDTQAYDFDELHSTNGHNDSFHSDADDISPFSSDKEHDVDDNFSKKPKTRRNERNKQLTGRRSKRDVDMTPPDELLKEAEQKAKRYVERKKEGAAIEELIRCTALARIVFGSSHWRLAKAHADLAAAYYDIKNYAPQAEYHSEHARDIVRNVQMTSLMSEKPKILNVVINIYYTLGRAQAQQKKYGDASESLNKAESVNQQRSQLDGVLKRDCDLWDIKISLASAKLKARQKSHGQAMSYYKRAIVCTEKLKGRDSSDLIGMYQGLGRVEQSRGELADHEKAIHYFQKAHEIASKRDPHGGVQVGDTAAGLAQAYASVGNAEAELSAESYFNDALAMYKLQYGPCHEKTISTQDELARLQIRADKHEEGIETLRSTLDAKKEVYGELSSSVAETWKLIGNVHLAQQSMEKALRALKKCHNIEVSLYGVNHRKSKDTQRTLDILMANPNLANKHKKSKADEIKDRPRFNNIIRRESRHGGIRTDTSY